MISARFVAALAAAAGAGLAAVIGSNNLELQELAGGVALLMSLLAGLAFYLDHQPETRPAPIEEAPPEIPRLAHSGIESALRGNRFARETVLLELDRIERAVLDPGLPSTSGEEMRRLAGLPLPEFRQYLSARLDRLERGS